MLDEKRIGIPRWGRIFFSLYHYPRPGRIWAPLSLYSSGEQGLFLWGQSGRGEKLTTHLQAVKKFSYTPVNKLVQKFTQTIVRTRHETRNRSDLYAHFCALQCVSCEPYTYTLQCSLLCLTVRLMQTLHVHASMRTSVLYSASHANLTRTRFNAHFCALQCVSCKPYTYTLQCSLLCLTVRLMSAVSEWKLLFSVCLTAWK
jgi:hypothetical protein